VKVAAGITRTHNPFDEDYWASCLRENLTSSSYGEGLETGREFAQEPRQSFTRHPFFIPSFYATGMWPFYTQTSFKAIFRSWSPCAYFNLSAAFMTVKISVLCMSPPIFWEPGPLPNRNSGEAVWVWLPHPTRR
jgi:hypothetical protein